LDEDRDVDREGINKPCADSSFVFCLIWSDRDGRLEGGRVKIGDDNDDEGLGELTLLDWFCFDGDDDDDDGVGDDNGVREVLLLLLG
jgi:hypothetical protein